MLKLPGPVLAPWLAALFLLCCTTGGSAAPPEPAPGPPIFAAHFPWESQASGWTMNLPARKSQAEGIFSGGVRQAPDGKGFLEITLKEPLSASASFVSPSFSLNLREFLVAEAEVEAREVGTGPNLWDRGAVVLHYADAGGRHISHADIVRIAGTHPRQGFQVVLIPPPAARQAKVLLSLGSAAAGTLRLHGVRIFSRPYGPAAQTAFSPDGLCPKPWRSRFLPGSTSVTGLRLVPVSPGLEDLAAASRKLFQSLGLIVATSGEKGAPSTLVNAVKLRLLKLSTQDPLDLPGLPLKNPSADLLGEEGYFLKTVAAASAKEIVIGSLTDRGAFYGLLTLAQLLRKVGPQEFRLPSAIILDRPALKLRGMASGDLRPEFLEKVGRLKFNEFQMHGAPGVWKDWDAPIDPRLRQKAAALAAQARAWRLDPTVVVWPGGYGRVFAWTSDRDRGIYFDKLELYRQAGFKGAVVVCASDYVRVGRGNGIVAPADLSRGLTLSAAHLGLMTYLARKFSKTKFGLELFPFYYQGAREYPAAELDYFRELAKLPREVEIIYGGRLTKEDVDFLAQVAGRPLLVRLPSPEPPLLASRRAPVGAVLASLAPPAVKPLISGFIWEAPPDDAILKELADFLWNFGRPAEDGPGVTNDFDP